MPHFHSLAIIADMYGLSIVVPKTSLGFHLAENLTLIAKYITTAISSCFFPFSRFFINVSWRNFLSLFSYFLFFLISYFLFFIVSYRFHIDHMAMSIVFIKGRKIVFSFLFKMIRAIYQLLQEFGSCPVLEAGLKPVLLNLNLSWIYDKLSNRHTTQQFAMSKFCKVQLKIAKRCKVWLNSSYVEPWKYHLKLSS